MKLTKTSTSPLSLNNNESHPPVSQESDLNEVYLKRKSTLTSESKDLL